MDRVLQTVTVTGEDALVIYPSTRDDKIRCQRDDLRNSRRAVR